MPIKRTHSETLDNGRGRGGPRGGYTHPHGNSHASHSQAMDTGEPAAKIQAGASQVHSNLRHIRTVEQPTRGRGVHTSTRGGYVQRGGSTTMNAPTSLRPQRPTHATRAPFQVSHTPAPALTTLVGGNADGPSSSNRSHNPTYRAPSTSVRAPTSIYNYNSQERNQPPPTRPPVAGYSPAPRHQTTSYPHHTVATQQAPPPATHQIPPPTHYQQHATVPGAVTYPTLPQQTQVQTYAYQPRHQVAPATSSYAHTSTPNTSYAPPVQRTSYAPSATSQYQSPATNHGVPVAQAPAHTASIPVATAPRSAKAMITNLPPNATFGRISSMTETCGVVRTINVRSENNSAIIEFVHPESVDSFIRSYHQQMFDNVMINVYRVV